MPPLAAAQPLYYDEHGNPIYEDPTLQAPSVAPATAPVPTPDATTAAPEAVVPPPVAQDTTWQYGDPGNYAAPQQQTTPLDAVAPPPPAEGASAYYGGENTSFAGQALHNQPDMIQTYYPRTSGTSDVDVRQVSPTGETIDTTREAAPFSPTPVDYGGLGYSPPTNMTSTALDPVAAYQNESRINRFQAEEERKRYQSNPDALTPTLPGGDFVKNELGRFLGLDPERQDLDMYNQAALNARNALGEFGQGAVEAGRTAAKFLTVPINSIRDNWNPPALGGPSVDPRLDEIWGGVEDAVGPGGIFLRGLQESAQNEITDPLTRPDPGLVPVIDSWQKTGPGAYFDKSYKEQKAAIDAGVVPPGETSRIQATIDTKDAAAEEFNKLATGLPSEAELEGMSIDGLRKLMTTLAPDNPLRQKVNVILGRRAAQQAGMLEGPLIPTPDMGGVDQAISGAADRLRGNTPGFQQGVTEQVSNVPPPYSREAPSVDRLSPPTNTPGAAYYPASEYLYESNRDRGTFAPGEQEEREAAPESRPVPQPGRPISTNLGPPSQPEYIPEAGAITAQPSWRDRAAGAATSARDWAGRQAAEVAANSADTTLRTPVGDIDYADRLPQVDIGLPTWNLTPPPLPAVSLPTDLDALPRIGGGTAQAAPVAEPSRTTATPTYRPTWGGTGTAPAGSTASPAAGAPRRGPGGTTMTGHDTSEGFVPDEVFLEEGGKGITVPDSVKTQKEFEDFVLGEIEKANTAGGNAPVSEPSGTGTASGNVSISPQSGGLTSGGTPRAEGQRLSSGVTESASDSGYSGGGGGYSSRGGGGYSGRSSGGYSSRGGGYSGGGGDFGGFGGDFPFNNVPRPGGGFESPIRMQIKQMIAEMMAGMGQGMQMGQMGQLGKRKGKKGEEEEEPFLLKSQRGSPYYQPGIRR